MSDSKRKARIEITSSASGVDRGISDARRKLRGFRRETEREAKRAERDAAKAAKRSMVSNGTYGMPSATNIASGITDALIDAGKGALQLDRQLTELQVSGEMSAKQTEAFRQALLAASKTSGIAVDELAQGSLEYVRFTGNADNATKSMELLAKTARATGASTSDVAGLFATLDKNVHLPVDQWEAALDMLVKQGHEGGVEMSDLAKSFASVAAESSFLFKGGATLEGLRQVSAEAQVLQNFTHSASLTSTYLKDMFNEFKKPGTVKRMGELGITPFTIDPKTKEKIIKDTFSLLKEIHKKVGDDPEKIGSLVRDIRGGNAMEYMLTNWKDVERIHDSSMGSGQLSLDYAQKQASASARIEVAMNKARVAALEAFSPDRLRKFADAAEYMADALLKVAHAIEDIIDAGWKHSSDKQKQKNANFLVDQAKNLTDKQKLALAKNYESGGIGTDELGYQNGYSDQERHTAAAALARQVGTRLVSDDEWNQSRPAFQYGPSAGQSDGMEQAKLIASEVGKAVKAALANQLAVEIGKAIKSLNIVVKADKNAIAQAGKNATIHRTPGRK